MIEEFIKDACERCNKDGFFACFNACFNHPYDDEVGNKHSNTALLKNDIRRKYSDVLDVDHNCISLVDPNGYTAALCKVQAKAFTAFPIIH